MKHQLSTHHTDIFWGEIAPSEHFVQFYESEHTFLDSLEGFIAGGLKRGESVILIITPTHQQKLEMRLQERGLDLARLRDEDRYISLDAENTLSLFMKNDWPDEELFLQVVVPLLNRARRSGERVLAFGEMVAILWQQGRAGATVALEQIWHRFCQVDKLSLFCAYPKIGVTEDIAEAIQQICEAHSKVYMDMKLITPLPN